jgi:nitric oxide reductase NorD protein
VTSPVTQERSSDHVCFADIHRLLALFAQGLAGRYLHLKLIEPQHAPRRNALMTDQASIFLPAQIDNFATAQHNLGAYRIAVLHQIGYWVEGTADFDLHQFFAKSSRPVLLRRIFFAIEDLRIDTALARRYPGARADLARVLAHALANRPAISSMPSLPALIEALVQFSLGAPRAALVAGDPSGLLDGLLDAAAAVQSMDADVHDSARASLAICAQLENLGSANDEQLPAPSLAEAMADMDGKPDGELGPHPDDLDHGAALDIEFRGDTTADKAVWRRPSRPVAASTREPPPFAGPMTEERSGGHRTLPLRSADATVLPLENTGPRSFLYDEWDFHRQVYLTAWCRVFEHRLRGEESGFIEDVRRRHSTLAHHVRRQFGFIKPQSRRRVRRTSDGDELELDGLIEAVIDRRTGHASDSHLYVRRDRALRDVAAAFLVDMSASTDFALPGSAAVTKPTGAAAQAAQSGLYLYGGHDEMPDPVFAPKRRVIDVSKDALALMCDALQALGDSYAIYGFSGDGRDNVEFHVAKDFADKLSLRTWGALAAMQPRRSTRMGAAIRHALSKLARETAGIKVLIIISDGYPEDHDYGTDRTDREYGIQDTAHALWEVERAGVTDFCVTIDPAGHDYLRRMCKETRYLVIDDVTALPHELTKIYRTLTAR